MDAEASIARTIRGGFRDKNYHYQKDQEGDDANAKSCASSVTDLHNGSNADIAEGPYNKQEMINTMNESFEDAARHRAMVKRDVQLYFNQAKLQIMEHVAKGIVFKLVYGTSNRMTEFMVKLILFKPIKHIKQ